MNAGSSLIQIQRGGKIMAVAELLIRKMKETLSKPIGIGNRQEIEFTLQSPQASRIFLAGTFNNWNTNSHPMKKNKDGIWRIKVRMAPGRYEYKFFVDGAWSQDLSVSDVIANPFGTQNGVISVH
jgi:1,4-alpha-glucan branching enzyme